MPDLKDGTLSSPYIPAADPMLNATTIRVPMLMSPRSVIVWFVYSKCPAKFVSY